MRRIRVIFEKTLRDLFSVKRTGIFLGAAVIVPLILAIMTEDVFGLAEMTLDSQTSFLSSLFLIVCFVWVAGLPLFLLTVGSCASFISGEVNKGTMLLLVSKPVKRWEILVGKFLAFLVYAMVIEFAALMAVPYIWSIVYDLSLYVFVRLLFLVIPVFLYSFFVIMLFASISSALSALSRNPVKITITLVLLAIFIFFGFSVVRQYTVPSGLYEKYNLYYYDVNYHLGNVYVFVIENIAQKRIAPYMQVPLAGFTGVYDVNSDFVEMDHGIMIESLPKYSYASAYESLLLWLIVSVIVIAAGITYFERKEIM
ncbi:MAG: ABC transporter permease subunit [archaeon]